MGRVERLADSIATDWQRAASAPGDHDAEMDAALARLTTLDAPLAALVALRLAADHPSIGRAMADDLLDSARRP